MALAKKSKDNGFLRFYLWKYIYLNKRSQKLAYTFSLVFVLLVPISFKSIEQGGGVR